MSCTASGEMPKPLSPPSASPLSFNGTRPYFGCILLFMAWIPFRLQGFVTAAPQDVKSKPRRGREVEATHRGVPENGVLPNAGKLGVQRVPGRGHVGVLKLGLGPRTEVPGLEEDHTVGTQPQAHFDEARDLAKI